MVYKNKFTFSLVISIHQVKEKIFSRMKFAELITLLT